MPGRARQGFPRNREPHDLRRHRLPLRHHPPGDRDDDSRKTVRPDDRGGLRKLCDILHHLVRQLHRDTRNLERVPRTRSEDTRAALESLPQGIQETQIRRTRKRPDIQVQEPHRGKGRLPPRQQADRRTAEGRRAHRLPLFQDVPLEGDRRSRVPLRAVRHGGVLGRQRRRLSRTPPLLRLRLQTVPRQGQPGIFPLQHLQEIRVHGAVPSRHDHHQLPGMPLLPRPLAIRDSRDRGQDIRGERIRHPRVHLRGSRRPAAGLRPVGPRPAAAPGRTG